MRRSCYNPLNVGLSIAAAAILGGCVVHVRARIADPTFPRTGMCPEAVAVFRSPAEVTKKYVEVAQLSTGPFGADFRPTVEQVERAQQKKAAQLGANGIILNHALGSRQLRYDDAVAIFIPEDSGHAMDVCAAARRAG